MCITLTSPENQRHAMEEEEAFLSYLQVVERSVTRTEYRI